MSLAQLKLLVILKVHLSMWNNARLAAEGVISDIIWPVQVALHCCQVRYKSCDPRTRKTQIGSYENRPCYGKLLTKSSPKRFARTVPSRSKLPRVSKS